MNKCIYYTTWHSSVLVAIKSFSPVTDGQGACGMRARRLGFGSILSAAAIVGDAVEDVEISAEVSF